MACAKEGLSQYTKGTSFLATAITESEISSPIHECKSIILIRKAPTGSSLHFNVAREKQRSLVKLVTQQVELT